MWDGGCYGPVTLTKRPEPRYRTNVQVERRAELVERAPSSKVGVLSGFALAVALLAWSLLRVVFRNLFTKPPPGLEVFHDNYGTEGLAPIDRDERQALARFSRCIACGRCDVGEGERVAASDGEYPGLMQLVIASTRSMPDYDAAARGFAHVPGDVLRAKEPRCPVRIPFAELARFVRARAGEDDG